MKSLTKLFYFIIIFFFFISINNIHAKPTLDAYNIKPGSWLRSVKVKFDEGEKDYALVQIYFPKGYKKGKKCRTLIALHGYAGNLTDWEKNSSIEAHANKYNMVIVCPDMRRSLYETKYYPETINKWAIIPGGKFVGEVLIKFLQKNFNLATSKSKTGIFGLSTGGRGALLVTAQNPGKFNAAAGLSGDYDPLSMTRDNLLTSVYGDYKIFKKRWESDDNILKMASKLKGKALFIGHGGKDTRVPSNQSLVLVMELKQLNKKLDGKNFVFIMKKKMRHDWKVWRLMLEPMMVFFDENLKR